MTGGLGRDRVYGGNGDDYVYINKPHIAAGELYDGGSGYDRIEIVTDLVESNRYIDISVLNIYGIESIESWYQMIRMTVAQITEFSRMDLNGLNVADGGVLDFTANPNVSVGLIVLSSQGKVRST